MDDDRKIRELARHFREFGVDDAEGWARSQVREEIPHYARYVFLRGAWQGVVDEGDTSWIDTVIRESRQHPHDPCAGAGPALERILAAGATREDIAELARVMQYEALYALTYQLAEPAIVDYPSEATPRVSWALFEVDGQGRPGRPIGALHESLGAVDPTGRGMRPKGVDREG